MLEASLNLTVRDFDAYLPEKATSNAFTRPRMEVKQRALAWGRRVLVRLADQGIHAELHASDEHLSLRNKKRVDCQSVWFWRDRSASVELDRLIDRGRTISAEIEDPAPFKRHAHLALRIDAGAVEVGFALHPDAAVDVENLRARLAAAEGTGSSIAAELTDALRKLPEQFTIGIAPAERVACGAATPEAIAVMLERVAQGQEPLWIGWSVPRDVALEHAEILDEQLEDAALALAPIYRLVAWSHENDHIALDRRLEGERLERARTHAEAEAETARWRAERERAIEQGRARRGGGAGAREPVATRPALDPPARPTSSAAIEKGSRVRVLTGAFAEKLGVVSGLDGRGGARVLLGLLSTRVELGDLEPVVEGRDRPALQSSHRRPGAFPRPPAMVGTPHETPPRKAR